MSWEYKYGLQEATAAKKFLKWQQKWDIDQTISKIIEWNESLLNKKNMREVTENQIKEYLK